MWYLVNYLDSKNIKDARDAGCSGMDFSAEFNACRPEWIRTVHDNGLKTACWTVDNREMLASMIDAGVEYIDVYKRQPISMARSVLVQSTTGIKL